MTAVGFPMMPITMASRCESLHGRAGPTGRRRGQGDAVVKRLECEGGPGVRGHGRELGAMGVGGSRARTVGG